jgi:hypothetical protein
MSEIAHFFDMLSACRENIYTSTNLQGLLKTLMKAKQYFDIENNDSTNNNIFRTNLKTTTNQIDEIMNNNATTEVINIKKIENMTGNKDFEDDLNSTADSDSITMTTVKKNTNYWKKITAKPESESDSDEDEGDGWETVEKKIKKKNHLKKTYTTMQVKKNDIKHIWKDDDNSTSEKKSTPTTSEVTPNYNKVSNIEKFYHNKRVAKMKTTNTREIINNMIGEKHNYEKKKNPNYNEKKTSTANATWDDTNKMVILKTQKPQKKTIHQH